jgi:CheY-like chemotaxis protein
MTPVWLAVEEEADLSDIIMGMFEVWSIHGVAFSNGQEAIQWIDNLDKGKIVAAHPELAMVDIRLPQSSGIEVAAKIRSSTLLGHIPIVLMTAYRLSPADIDQLMLESGADLLMYKPLPAMTELRKTLNDLLEEKTNHKKVGS